MKKSIGLCLVFSIFFLAGCGCHRSWFSKPAIQTSDNGYYAIQLEPIKDERRCFASFRLTVSNKTMENLEIDWNKTLYLQNGRTKGRFSFSSLNSKNIDNPPPDVIRPGTSLSKKIWPIRLNGQVSSENHNVSFDQKAAVRGHIPEGENGIYLVARQNAVEVQEKITVKITSVQVK